MDIKENVLTLFSWIFITLIYETNLFILHTTFGFFLILSQWIHNVSFGLKISSANCETKKRIVTSIHYSQKTVIGHDSNNLDRLTIL